MYFCFLDLESHFSNIFSDDKHNLSYIYNSIKEVILYVGKFLKLSDSHLPAGGDR